MKSVRIRQGKIEIDDIPCYYSEEEVLIAEKMEEALEANAKLKLFSNPKKYLEAAKKDI